MSIPITTDTDLFPKEGFCPGAGVLAVHVPDAYDFSSHSLEEAVKRGIPPCTSFGRPPMQFTRRVQALLYSNIRAAVNSLFESWGEHVSRREKPPVVNHTYMEKWFERMHLNREEVMAQMGVAQPGDTIDLGLTPKGGRKVVITTFENAYGEAFARRREEVYHGNLSKPVLLEMLIDITILTALAEFNHDVRAALQTTGLDGNPHREAYHDHADIGHLSPEMGAFLRRGSHRRLRLLPAALRKGLVACVLGRRGGRKPSGTMEGDS